MRPYDLWRLDLISTHRHLVTMRDSVIFLTGGVQGTRELTYLLICCRASAWLSKAILWSVSGNAGSSMRFVALTNLHPPLTKSGPSRQVCLFLCLVNRPVPVLFLFSAQGIRLDVPVSKAWDEVTVLMQCNLGGEATR